MSRRTIVGIAIAAAAAAGITVSTAPAEAATWTKPPANAKFDYQIGGDYTPATGVKVVSRDWYIGTPLTGAGTYSICYVNAFQTQDDEPGVNRPDERSNWPADLVLTELGDDPNWGGEYLIDISTATKRAQALDHIDQMVDTCATKGFKAVEYDNLDSWTRFEGTPLADDVPFGKAEAIAYAELITDYAHGKGLAVAQKNTSVLTRTQSLTTIGFDFAIAEECGQFKECLDYTAVFGNDVFAIEYKNKGFTWACNKVGSTVSVVRRNVLVTVPGTTGYKYDHC